MLIKGYLHMKKWQFLLPLLGFLFSLYSQPSAGAADAVPSQTTSATNSEMNVDNSVFIPPTDPNIQYSGRFDFSNPSAPRFDWPAVSISAIFQGTAVGILLDDGNNDYDVFIDGNLQKVIVTGSSAEYTVAGLKAGLHDLLLVKRTEAYFGAATFKGLLLQKGMGLLKPLSPAPRRIEFVGDSLACGAEVEDPNTDCDPAHFRPTANCYLAFGPLAARALGVESRVTSFSATGVVRNVGMAKMPMPAYYSRVLAGFESPVIDPRQWIPDAVVIELGGNDFFSGAPQPSGEEFEGAYIKFLSTLRADYPHAHIFCLTFGTSPPAGNLIQDVVAREKKAGDDKVSLIVLDYPANHLTGCYKHFDREGQRQVGDQLARMLAEDMGWKADSSKPKNSGEKP